MSKLEILEAIEEEHGQFWNDDKRQKVLEQPFNVFLKIVLEFQEWHRLEGKMNI